MLKKLFEKIAAKVKEEKAKERLFRLYCAKSVLLIAFAVFLFAWAVEIAVFWNLTDPAAVDAAFAVYGVTMFLWTACGIAALVLQLVFRARLRRAVGSDATGQKQDGAL